MSQKKQLALIREDLKSNRTHMEVALPITAKRYLTPERVCKIVLMGIGKTPKLLQCTRESILRAVMDCVTLGLEPGSALGHAYLVPYKTRGVMQANAIIGYRGYIEMARRSGQIESVNCNIVYERDDFDMDLGTGTIRHKPFFSGDRGEHRLIYCITRFRGGGQHLEYMTFDQIDKVRDRSPAREDGPWVTDYLEMARKTVVKRAAKYWPLSVEIAEAMELENRAESGEDAIDVPFVLSLDEGVPDDERSETEKLTDDLRAQKVGAEAAVEARLRRKKVGAEVERGGKPVPLSVLVDRVRALVGYEGDDVKGWAEKKLDQKVEGLDSLTPEQMQELHTELDQVEAVMFEGKKDP